VVDPGPPFDASGRPEHEEPEHDLDGATLHELPPPVDLWDERRVEQILVAKGEILHQLVAVEQASREWRYTETDLKAIAPPLTAILNRYEPTRAAAHVGDELALVIGFGGYTARSIMERRQALARLHAEPEPASGVAAEPGTGPEHDPDYPAAAGHIPDPDEEPAPIGRPRR
jgi:hypothetical protein